MAKKQKHFMDLNRETAMRLWSKSFGKETKVKDFTGREIAKGAYNDRNSEYGWNVDHILPQSRGGKTADHNLICCHILTNDEKADRFPCFVANNLNFEIVKVENHYEIKRVTKTNKPQKEEDDSNVNFYDSASGIRFFKKLKGIQNKPRWVASILIRLQNVNNTAVIDFIEKFFDKENISYSMNENYSTNETRIIARNFDAPFKEDISSLLDKCILLNTYLGHYFLPLSCINGYEIFYRADYFKEKKEMYIESQYIDFANIKGTIDNTLYINNSVIRNTDANKTLNEKYPSAPFFSFRGQIMSDIKENYQEYNYVFTNLSKNLNKEVNGK